MSKSNSWEAGLLNLLFNNTDYTGVGDAGGLLGSVVAGSLYISLHTADPGEGGNQTTNEIAYTNYVRVAVARNAGGWTVSGVSPAQAVNTADITFPACAGAPNTVTHFGVGTDAAGAGKLLYSNAVDAPLLVAIGITPQFLAGSLVVTEE